MKIIATIEVRMQSTRLPGKSLANILGKPLLQLMIERIKNSKLINEIVITTSKQPENDTIEDLARKINIKCYRGSEDDVLDRVLKAAKSINGDVIVELWGDSPLIDYHIIDRLIQFYLENKYDCVGTVFPNFKRTYPLGISALIFSTKILEEVNRLTKNPIDRENVSNYIYEHPDRYKIALLPCPEEINYPDYRLTIDEQKDLDLMKIIFERLYPSNPQFRLEDVIRFLKENPSSASLNKDVVQRKLPGWEKLRT